ncbi:Di-copper centre-containing protein [Lentithecium fluviatile CBS 122367]|uniref:Di-copper centre-containing protein n=1 Tax=Lentithecium fluviatile CBS 122367 TaxID=1168545 RepID=A0A6G1IP66_9PLEO|nr:Di-copper centre-containing protein [Lentithecium fluviatile CBS 122367]
MNKLVAQYQTNTKSRLPKTGACRADNLKVRREWGDLSNKTRLEYIKAVKCLARLPSKIDPAKAPGARSRYDDFEAAHIIHTTTVHATGLFFAWHRHMLYLYEKALREECSYSDWLPYWDWARWADAPIKANPLWDGSATSMSGNGKYIPNRNGTIQPAPIPDGPALYTDPGTGGGYIFEGPFVDWQLHLGPVVWSVVQNGQPVNKNPRDDGLGYNPRKMIRDFNATLIKQGANYQILTDFLVNKTTIADFHMPFFGGPHLAGHLFVSGYDNDLYTSPQDPLFWFHHGQVDRMWSIWQGLDYSTREYALDGTLTFLNTPPSRNATLDDLMPFEFSPDVAIKKAMSTTKEAYCYIYA